MADTFSGSSGREGDGSWDGAVAELGQAKVPLGTARGSTVPFPPNPARGD